MKEIKDLGTIQDNRFSGNSTNTKELYLVLVDEPNVVFTSKSKKSISVNQTTYLGIRADETFSAVKISGYDITNNVNITTLLKKAKTYNEVIDSIKDAELEFQVLTFSWQRIIRIKQLKFTQTK